MAPIPVLVVGACGQMGREVVRAVHEAEDLELVGAVDTNLFDEDIGVVAGIGPIEIPVTNDLKSSLLSCSQHKVPGVMVDFTRPETVYENIREAVAFGIRPVVGTTGLTPAQIDNLGDFCDKSSMGCLIAPNFAIGVLLLQEAAQRATKYFDHVEIIELHHNRKLDAPSGTAYKTAEMMAEFAQKFNPALVEEKETLPGVRGGVTPEGIRIHSVRLPGMVAHQEVIFGGLGQIYTLRHDAIDRKAYMPGVLLGIRRVIELKSLVYGLEKLL
jgi:4-hydroxy-tetrahydrodipicolinate reductase